MHSAISTLIAALVITGFGFSLFSSPNANAIMSAVDKQYYGSATGSLATMRILGQMTSMVVVTLVFSMLIGQITIEPSVYEDLMQAISVCFFISAGLCIPGFIFSLVREIKRFQPDIYSACLQAYEKGKVDKEFYRLDKDAFIGCPSDSIDYAVMEKLTNKEATLSAVVALDAGWSDIGAWSAVWELGEQDKDGNVIAGDVIQEGTSNSLLKSEHRLVATLGCDNLVVVETADVVLVASKDKAQEVKEIISTLEARQREERLTHRRVFRPWGSYETLDSGKNFQVKRLTVNPGKKLSLQLHHKRAEHWVVVNGTATVTKGEEVFQLKENESTYIPVEVKHRLENATDQPLEIIEVQSGSYLGEDDIERFEDDFGRE